MQSDDPAATTGNTQGSRSSRPLRRVVGAVGSLLTNTVVERATRFVLFAAVARTLGAESLGQLSLSIAILQLIGRLVVLGIPVLAIREVARDPGTTRFFMVRGAATAFLAALVGYAGLAGFLFVANYDPSTVWVIVALLAAMIPFAWSRISEGILIGRHKAAAVAYVGVPVNVTLMAVALFFLADGRSVAWVAGCLGVGWTLIALFQGIVVLRDSRGQPISLPDRNLVRESAPFFGIQATTVVRSSSTTIIVSLVVGEFGVGIYSAALQLQMPLRIVGNVLATAVFPTLTTVYEKSRDLFSQAASRATELTIAVLLPGVAGLLVVGADLLDLIFDGGAFEESVPVLRLLAVSAFGMAVASVLGRVLMAADREAITLRIAAINTAIQIVALIVLTSAYGVIGAATAALVVALFNIVQHIVPTRKVAPSVSVVGVMWAPALASAAMVVVLIAANGVPVLIRIVLAAVVYAGALLGIWLLAAGGRAELKRRWAFDSGA